MHLKNSSVAERRFIGKEAAACLPSSDSDPKPKIKHHRPLQVPETVEIADSSSPPQSSHPFDLRRGGGGSSRASLGSILSFLSSSLPSIPSATNQKLIRQVLRVRLICFHLRFLLLLSVPPLYVFFLLISFRFFLLFVFSILTFSFILSISLKLALPHLPSIGLIIARLLSLKLTPARSSFSSSSQVVWSIGSKPVTEKKTSSGSWVQKYSSGDVYEGEFHKGKCSGSGVYYYSMKGKYEGDWVDGKYDGYGVETWAKGSRYRGQYRQGMRHGAGIYRFYTGDVYAGEWSNGQSHGCGVYTSEDGSRFVGEFKWGVKHGLGHYHFRNGDTYAGEYFADRMHGFGVYQFGNGHRYEGAWHEGRRQGLGMYTFRNGETQAGHWDDGVLSCPTEQTTRPGSSFSISHSKVLDTVQQARKAAEKAHEAVKVEERVNRTVMVANRAANSARVAATKAVQTKTYYSSGGDDPLCVKAFDIVTVMNLTSNFFGNMREKNRDI
ncbi:BnaC08g10880D [Brassica napus]|uniref:BnaC08g10880D protein n=1 Tax=Brassica napus TaxID=3708 RepID=A0A078HY68_BRANA|nr:BnaC08g10880D [Brassica napus]